MPVASLEMVTVINLPSDDPPDGMNITLRGLTQSAWIFARERQIVERRWFEPGNAKLW